MGLFSSLRLRKIAVDSADEVTTNFKPEQIICPCGCGITGRLLRKATGKGEIHVYKCKCVSHRNGRNRRNGLTAQRKAARAIGVPASNGFLPSDEELYGGSCRVEVKSGAQVRPMFTAFQKAWLQSDAARSLGDSRPIVIMSKLQPNGKDGLVSFRISDLEAVIYALATNLGYFDD